VRRNVNRAGLHDDVLCCFSSMKKPEVIFLETVKEKIADERLKVHLAYEEASRALHLVIDVDDLDDVPDASCVAKHLPKDRQPTREDIDAAFAACRKKI
jgi:hypothetical protein